MRTILKLIISIFLFLSFGCANVVIPEGGILSIKARYGDLQKLMETEISQSGDANTYQLFSLCEAYSALKRYDRLFECCDRLESNIRKGKKSIYDASLTLKAIGKIGEGLSLGEGDAGDVSSTPFIFRAQAYIELGNYEKAIKEAQMAYDLAPLGKEQVNQRIIALGNLSLAYALNGNREEALMVAEGISLEFNRGAKNIPLARTYMALREFDKALNFIRAEDSSLKTLDDLQSSVIGKLVLGVDNDIFFSVYLPNLFLKNKCLMETGRIDEAKIGYDTLLKIPQTRDNGEIYWMILFDRGRIAEQDGNLKEAINFYRHTIDIIEQQRSTINTETSKIGFVGDKQSVYHRLISALFMDGQYTTAFEYVERSKSRALVDMLAAKQNFAIKGGDEQMIHELLAQNTSREAELRVPDISLNKTEMRSMVIKNREKLMEQSPELASLVSVASLAAAEIQSNIPRDETLVEYYYAGKDMYAFILSARTLKAIKLNGDNLADDIKQFRKLLNNPGLSGYGESSRLLYDRLIKPIESSLENHNLIIVPHGSLHYLPFNALHNGKGYLMEKYSIRMFPSASVIKYLQGKKSSKPGDILVFGDPLHNLEGAQKEALAVAKTQTQSKVLLGKEATETALNKYGRGFNYIHFATHGQFNADAPLSSALLLAGDAESNGLLTVDKLYSMKLDADLVTLSACETGLGKIANGDDSVGLSRGFLYAGSSSIVASLWKVDDLATSYLMTLFYSNLKLTDKREALRSAQIVTMGKYPHPFYWASFQLTGNAK